MMAKDAFTEARQERLRQLSQRLGVSFNNLSLLHQALIHSSFANEAKRNRVANNERLEFLGDAVLELSVSSYLYENFPQLPEGALTRARAAVVCTATLSKLGLQLGLGECLLLGHGEAMSGGATRPTNLEDAFESVIGAIYVDQGWEAARAYVLQQLAGEFQSLGSDASLQDYKTILQERIQKSPNNSLFYEELSESGPDHCKSFEFAVRINGEILGTGIGRSKKEAEQRAAREALSKLK